MVEELAERLLAATAAAAPIEQLSATTPLTLDDAYAVQAAGIRLGGDPVVGVKLGFTSREKAEQMGVSDVIIGVLTRSMSGTKVPVPNVPRNKGACPLCSAEVELARLIHPRIEPEVAFRLDADGNASHVAAAVEIIDSRYANFRFSLEDVVADNTSAARFAVGEWHEFDHDLKGLQVTLTADGETISSGTTTAILGDPAEAIPTVHRLARAHGQAVNDGAIVLAGAATAATEMERGRLYEARVEGLGTVAVSSV